MFIITSPKLCALTRVVKVEERGRVSHDIRWIAVDASHWVLLLFQEWKNKACSAFYTKLQHFLTCSYENSFCCFLRTGTGTNLEDKSVFFLYSVMSESVSVDVNHHLVTMWHYANVSALNESLNKRVCCWLLFKNIKLLAWFHLLGLCSVRRMWVMMEKERDEGWHATKAPGWILTVGIASKPSQTRPKFKRNNSVCDGRIPPSSVLFGSCWCHGW